MTVGTLYGRFYYESYFFVTYTQGIWILKHKFIESLELYIHWGYVSAEHKPVSEGGKDSFKPSDPKQIYF